MKRLAFCTAFLLLLAGCDPTDPLGSGSGQGTMTAGIAGDPFNADIAFARPCITCGTLEDGIEISGIEMDGTTIGLGVIGFNGEGTYSLHEGGPGGGAGLGGGATVSLASGESFATDWEGGSGTLEVTDLTDDAIEGTFSFTALDGPGGESIRVTDGEFNVTLCETYDDPACFASVRP